MQDSHLPFVSVVMPCLNERDFIAGCLDSILENDYPQSRLEILVVDGLSTDGTQEILARYEQKHPFIRILQNPEKIKPRALNIGIGAARGDVIFWMSAHALYDTQYVSKCVKCLSEHQADTVGGILKALPRSNTVMARAIAHSISHPFAAGNAIHRTGSNEVKYVDTVFGGCYPREVFQRIGLFNESLLRGQDREFNTRLRRAGGKILLVPDIVSYYFARDKFLDYCRWIFVGGMTPFYISRIVRSPLVSWRNLVPLSFLTALFVSLVGSVLIPQLFWLFLAVVSVYLAVAILAAVSIARKERDWRFLLAMPLVFIATHTLYGIGSAVGITKKVEPHSEWTRV